MLCGWKGPGNLPVKLRNTQTDQETIMDRLLQRQQKQKEAHDTTTRDLPELIVSQRVTFQQQDGLWTPGRIVEKCQEPRSYLVEQPNGGVLRRNRSHLHDFTPQKTVRFAEKTTAAMPHGEGYAEQLKVALPPKED